MKKASLASLALLFFASIAAGLPHPEAATFDGLWTAAVFEDQIRFRMTVFEETNQGEWNMSLTVARSRLDGLAFDKDHTFKLTGDAGTITFRGKFSEERGTGSFTFVADAGFIEFLAGKKFGRIDDKKLIFFLIGDVDKAYVQNLESLGYADISSSRLVDLAIHRVSQEYIKEMQAFWGTNLSLSKIIEFKIHGITKKYIDEMVKTGFEDLSPNKIVELKIHGLTAAYIQGVRSFGLGEISLDKALEFKIHGIDKEYVEYCKKLLKGKDLTPDKVINLKIHGI